MHFLGEEGGNLGRVRRGVAQCKHLQAKIQYRDNGYKSSSLIALSLSFSLNIIPFARCDHAAFSLLSREYFPGKESRGTAKRAHELIFERASAAKLELFWQE